MIEDFFFFITQLHPVSFVVFATMVFLVTVSVIVGFAGSPVSGVAALALAAFFATVGCAAEAGRTEHPGWFTLMVTCFVLALVALVLTGVLIRREHARS